MLKLASDGIINFSAKPLKFIGTLAIISFLASFFILVFAIISFCMKLDNMAPGWASIMVTMTFLSGVILSSLYIVGEYISRIFDNIKARPEYIVERTINVD